MLKYLLFYPVFLVCLFAQGQEVISSQGDSYSNANGIIDFTIGEVVIATAGDANHDITQGFHQTNWNFVGLEDFALGIEASIFPNPTQNILNIKVKEYQDLNYCLNDSQGKIIREGQLAESETAINVSELPVGSYSLTLLNKNEQIKTFKLIKTQN